jgi:NAD-dependent SIR2 family protein deacetylase
MVKVTAELVPDPADLHPTGPDPAAVDQLASLFDAGGAVILSGAGLSTESGIPDYRGPSGAAQRNHTPMTYQAFTKDPAARHRYWARSYLGWRSMSGAHPNAGHLAVAQLQRIGVLNGIITQNVDGLQQAAGARDVIELHGGLDRTVCLNCGDHAPRAELDRRLREANPTFDAHVQRINPDGDADLADEDLGGFTMVDCLVCGSGPLKPDVVFFGETVPRDRVDACFELVEGASSLIVLGSSLTVMSGYRFVLAAAKRNIPVAIVNQGSTRGDAKATLRLDAPLGATLTAIAAELTPTRAGASAGPNYPGNTDPLR